MIVILVSCPWEECSLRVFDNMVLRRIFGSMTQKITGDWIELQKEEIHNLYSSENGIRLIKSRKM
jgi:hypothetical protein